MFLTSVIVHLTSAIAFAGEPIELFNGTDLAGWKQYGGAHHYAAEDGAIVGRSVPHAPNAFLATENEFSDFELEMEFKIDDTAFNSGVQIRSHSVPEHNRGRVFGYQVEIDPRPDRAWTGGIYFEGGSPQRRAGWLADLSENQAGREAFRLGEWNHFRIVAQGRRIQVWLNGVETVDYTDEDDAAFIPSGFIALQVHSVGGAEEPKEVRWRNIRLTTLE